MKFSIITINFNNREGLLKTMQSVLSQTFVDYEYIIIDGGSTDGSREVIESYKEKLSYWCSEPDGGIYNAMNKGIEHARGEYLNFMNSGDLFYSATVLEKIVSSNSSADVIYGRNPSYQESIIPLESMSNPAVIFCRGTINHQTAFIKRNLFEKRLYDESLRIVSDWKFFFEVAIEGGSFELVDVIVAIYDTNGTSGNIELAMKERMEVLAEYFPKIVVEQLQDDVEVYNLPIVQNSLYLLKSHSKVYFIVHKVVKVIVNIAKMMKK